MRVPVGVVAAIAPFNFPLNLVAHKVGPALAAGNAVLITPATDTPLSALKLVEILLEAGVPPLAVNCITGSGPTVGSAICADPRVRKISFTGSQEVGEQICKVAGLKRVTMELGSNSPLIVMPDADMEQVVDSIMGAAYGSAGERCMAVSVMVAVGDEVADALVERLRPRLEALKVGPYTQPDAEMGPVVNPAAKARICGCLLYTSDAADE